MVLQKGTAFQENEIDKLIKDIKDGCERIQQIFDKIENDVSETKAVYDCDSANIYREKFEYLKSDFKTVVSNIFSYSTDLNKLKLTYDDTKSLLSKKLESDAIDIASRRN